MTPRAEHHTPSRLVRHTEQLIIALTAALTTWSAVYYTDQPRRTENKQQITEARQMLKDHEALIIETLRLIADHEAKHHSQRPPLQKPI